MMKRVILISLALCSVLLIGACSSNKQTAFILFEFVTSDDSYVFHNLNWYMDMQEIPNIDKGTEVSSDRICLDEEFSFDIPDITFNKVIFIANEKQLVGVELLFYSVDERDVIDKYRNLTSSFVEKIGVATIKSTDDSRMRWNAPDNSSLDIHLFNRDSIINNTDELAGIIKVKISAP